MFEIKHWPESAIKCDSCTDIIQACYLFWFDDETGERLCEDCYDYQVHENVKGK